MEKTAFLPTVRLKSTRLPKKILLEVAGKPLIVCILDRLKCTYTIDKIIICTSSNPQDDPLEQVAEQEGIYCFRGSENDVLKRLLDAAKKADVKNIVGHRSAKLADYDGIILKTFTELGIA